MTVFELLDQGSTQSAWRFGISQFFFQQSQNKARTGVLPSGAGLNLSVAQTTTASGSVTVQAGTCVIADASTSQGAHVLSSDSVVTLDVLGANPATSLPRIDLVVADGGLQTIHAVTGTPASVPTAPTLPATSALLATLSIAANASTIPNGKIVDGRVYSALRGAALYVNDITERNAVGPSCQDGQRVWVISEQRMYTSNGGNTWDDTKTSGLATAASGWSMGDVAYATRNGVVYINAQIKRTGAKITAPGNGNLADDAIATLSNADMFPTISPLGSWSDLTGTGAHGSARVNTAGGLVLSDCTPGGVINTGDNVNLSFVYPI